MQLTYTALVLGSLASLVAAHNVREFQFPDSVPMHKRQTSGPAYQCHANCGYTIMNAKEAGYCESAEWKQLLSDCLKCANQYELWPDYGDSVKAAAQACGIDAVPDGAAADATPSSAGPRVSADNLETMPTFVVDSTEAAAPGSSASETSPIIVTPAESSIAVTTTQSVLTTVTSAPSETTAAATDAPATATVSGAASNMLSGALVLGAALLAAVNLM